MGRKTAHAEHGEDLMFVSSVLEERKNYLKMVDNSPNLTKVINLQIYEAEWTRQKNLESGQREITHYLWGEMTRITENFKNQKPWGMNEVAQYCSSVGRKEPKFCFQRKYPTGRKGKLGHVQMKGH